MTKYRFDHVGFLTPDMDRALATYRAIGCDLMERNYRRDNYDLAYSAAATDVLLEFQAPPLLAESEEHVAAHGFGIERIALSCDDVQKAYDDLIAAGVESVWAPDPFVVDGVTLAIAAGVWSPEGLMIDLVQHVDVAVPRPTRGDRGDLALHHACCLTPDLAAAERFWTEHFGLVKTYDFTAPLDPANPEAGTKGFIMLGDGHYDEAGHDFSLEIIGGEFDSIDGPAFEAKGPHYDHVCFTTSDVAGVWERAVAAGVESLSEPAFYEEYSSTIAWLYDADGTHVELMNPVPDGMMSAAHRSGICSNDWTDDWQRSPVVFPRSGDKAVEIQQ